MCVRLPQGQPDTPTRVEVTARVYAYTRRGAYAPEELMRSLVIQCWKSTGRSRQAVERRLLIMNNLTVDLQTWATVGVCDYAVLRAPACPA